MPSLFCLKSTLLRAPRFRLLCLMGAWLCCVSGALGEIRLVTSMADSTMDPAVGTLRRAISDAEQGDTIQFAPEVTGVITLAGAELLIEKSLTISGPGSDQLAISGNQQSRILRNRSALVITGLTLRDGKAADGAANSASGGAYSEDGGNGGAILNTGVLTVGELPIHPKSGGKWR